MKKVYGRGDQGYTEVVGGVRLPKHHYLIKALGDLDELISLVGLTRAVCKNEEVNSILEDVQRDLMRLSAELASLYAQPPKELHPIFESDVLKLENLINSFVEKLPKQVAFILPSGTQCAMYLYYLRSVCRRAERSVVEVLHRDVVFKGHGNVVSYLNRLSDLLYILFRVVNLKEGYKEEYWREGGTY